MLFSTIVFMNLVGRADLLRRRRLTARAIVGAALGVAGVALLFLPELATVRADVRTANGIAFGLAAVLLASAGNLVAVRNHKASLPTLARASRGRWDTARATATVFAIVSGAAWTFDPRAPYVASLAYLAVFGSIVAFGAYLTLVRGSARGRRRTPASRPRWSR